MDSPGEQIQKAIRVVLVDDQELVRAGFRMILDSQPELRVVGEAGDGVQALELLKKTEADVVVLDVRMPRMDGVETARRICAEEGHPQVLILTTFDLDAYVYAALKAGASGFLLKDTPPAALLSAIRSVHYGDAVVDPSATRRLLDRFAERLPTESGQPVYHESLQELTPREREVLGMVARGRSDTEIADRLYVSETTVKTHISRILTKLDLRDRVQAVVLAYETGLVGGRGDRRETPPV
ncbi:response regulator transcription factor [Nocardiopsis sp. HUAS JQ3]|uniref:response regulator n=1 Tax=Nocardiopsis sp. HUAS JQ3 TaxID=3061629 RepID=UPI0023A92E65|nr:response regulator transcription factor [Nocardiopsis sp. HUAS JQ3]WDZ90608.1 response regulator transcription factor [Nocardiopsis sp. HUAS JQ3]